MKNSELSAFIDDMVPSKRNRELLKERLIDGIKVKDLALAYDLMMGLMKGLMMVRMMVKAVIAVAVADMPAVIQWVGMLMQALQEN